MDKTETLLFDLILNCNSVIDIRCRRDSHHFDYSAPVNTLVGFIVHSVYQYIFVQLIAAFVSIVLFELTLGVSALEILFYITLHYITYVICVFPWRIPTYPKVDVGSLMCARTQSVRAGQGTGKGETFGALTS